MDGCCHHELSYYSLSVKQLQDLSVDYIIFKYCLSDVQLGEKIYQIKLYCTVLQKKTKTWGVLGSLTNLKLAPTCFVDLSFPLHSLSHAQTNVPSEAAAVIGREGHLSKRLGICSLAAGTLLFMNTECGWHAYSFCAHMPHIQSRGSHITNIHAVCCSKKHLIDALQHNSILVKLIMCRFCEIVGGCLLNIISHKFCFTMKLNSYFASLPMTQVKIKIII